MNDQEAFEFAVTHVIKQGRASMRDTLDDDGEVCDTQCAYRGDNGARCHGGWLIPDERYNSAMEGVSVNDSIFFTFPEIVNLNNKILLQCQLAHDQTTYREGPEFVEGYVERIRLVARDFNLDASFIDKVLAEMAA